MPEQTGGGWVATPIINPADPGGGALGHRFASTDDGRGVSVTNAGFRFLGTDRRRRHRRRGSGVAS